MKRFDTVDYRKKTIEFWSAFRHPSNERDIARVYAFRELDPSSATDEQVDTAYGGPGWAPVPACTECGRRGEVVVFGQAELPLCESCIVSAAAVVGALGHPVSPAAPLPAAPPQPAAKPGFFSRLLGA